MGRPKKYPIARMGVCIWCKRICTTWITSGQKMKNNQYCGETCKKVYKTSLMQKAQTASIKLVDKPGRRRVKDVPGPTEYEEQLWK